MVSALDYEEGDPGSIPGSGRLSTDFSVLGGNLTGYCYQHYRPRLDKWGGN